MRLERWLAMLFAAAIVAAAVLLHLGVAVVAP
jgi:hypothetical protein